MNIPEIRFKGFTNTWEQRKLGEMADIFDGTHQTPDYVNEGIMFLSVENITSLTSKKFISETEYNKNFKTVPEYGDVLMTRIGDIGTANVVRTNEKLAYYVSLALLKPKNSDADFLTTSIHSPYVQKELWERTLHVAFPKKINLGEIENISIQAPKKEEQTLIGTFFRTLDTAIALHQRKLDGLRRLKKAYLQQMLPQDGERVPRVRFDGFSGEWETRGANEIFRTISDKNHSELPVLSASQELGMVFRDKIGIDIKFDSANTTTYKRVKPGQFVIHLRSFQGGLAYSSIEGITSPAYTILDFIEKDKQVSEFWVDILKSDNFIKTLESVTYGIRDGRSISFNDFSMLKLSFPNVEEQILIANFFSNIDNQITVQSQKLEQLKQLKSAYLQKMFV